MRVFFLSLCLLLGACRRADLFGPAETASTPLGVETKTQQDFAPQIILSKGIRSKEKLQRSFIAFPESTLVLELEVLNPKEGDCLPMKAVGLTGLGALTIVASSESLSPTVAADFGKIAAFFKSEFADVDTQAAEKNIVVDFNAGSLVAKHTQSWYVMSESCP